MAALAYYSFKYGAKLRATGEVSMTQKIPYYPFVYGMAVCFLVTLLVLIRDLIKSITKGSQDMDPGDNRNHRHRRAYRHLPVGHAVAFSMAFVGVIGFCIIKGPDAGLGILAR